MIQRKIAYSEIALSKRKAIKKDIKEKYGKGRADKFSKHISKSIAELKKFPELGVSLKEKYDLNCDYYMLFIERNYFIYRIFEDMILILEIFNEKEDIMYQLFGIVTTSQDTLDYWGEE
ncbi:MAG: type II toxin-antitoxin system RelE/ParE family toxin [Lachnospiraceae bacterium]|nr:type II toxin-antitoxin system RelE/ParE family toxin [Lachnospiraceae bacterium]